MTIVELDDSLEKKYENFIKSIDKNLFFVSNKYRKLLCEFLGDEDHYFLLLDDHDNIQAALPSFLKRDSEVGNVLNSLPFFGSNGLVFQEEKDWILRSKLISHFIEFAKNNECCTATVITSPFETEMGTQNLEDKLSFTYKSERIGQITPLPRESESLRDDLMEMYHQKTRNSIRKPYKENVEFSRKKSSEALDFLINTHKENMEAVGGKHKPASFFEIIPKIFEYGDDFQIYYATYKGNLISAILLFYYNNTVEYFCPATDVNYRNLQPSSMLIYEAMVDAASRGYLWWNWGGTWKSQKGVYRFKKKWGTKDFPYYYYTTIFRDHLYNYTPEKLSDTYRYYYLIPFDKLEIENNA